MGIIKNQSLEKTREEIKNKARPKSPFAVRHCDRPRPALEDFFCVKCQCNPEAIEETCGNNHMNSSMSQLYLRVFCHDETADILMSFAQWHDSAHLRPIELFTPTGLPEKEIKETLPAPPLRLEDQGQA